LPTDFLAVSLLDSANTAQREGATFPHPFDSAAGREQLENWLTDRDEDHFSYAVSATAAIPSVSGEKRDALLALAFDHPSTDVQMEAAWATAKLGREAGIARLARFCLDVNLAERARQYLEELGRTDAIPEEAEDAGFRAKAEFAQWLAHPNELGHPPDAVEIVDHRELSWPPEREQKPMWLLRYRVRDQSGLKEDEVGVGLVGSVTFCLFTYKLEQRPPEDAYAIHGFWELQHRELILETEVPENSTEYDGMLQQCKIEGLGEVSIVSVAELSAELEYPQDLVALGKATRHGQSGWIVLDGPRSRWYAAAEMPTDNEDNTVLMLHVSRVLLGFRDEPDRRKYLHPAGQPRPPEQIVIAYERLLKEAGSEPKQTKKLLGRHSVLGSTFPDYVSALIDSRSQSRAACTCLAYESLLAVAEHADRSLQGEVLACFSPLGENFDGYVDALIELNRQADVRALLEKFQPHWEHNRGYSKLGGAAFRSGHDEIAEKLLVTLRQSMSDWCRCEEIGYLAEIWRRQGRDNESRALLIDALKRLLEQSGTATGRDCELFEEWFQARRSTYLKLFPERGSDELQRQGIPISTFDNSPES